jgi:hypothetical protein
LGIASVSLVLASGASASIGEATTNIPPTSQSHEIFLGEEEISDVSLATFYVFDKENTGPSPLAQKPRLTQGCGGCACGRCGGCGGRRNDYGCGGCSGSRNTNGGCGGGVDGY